MPDSAAPALGWSVRCLEAGWSSSAAASSSCTLLQTRETQSSAYLIDSRTHARARACTDTRCCEGRARPCWLNDLPLGRCFKALSDKIAELPPPPPPLSSETGKKKKKASRGSFYYYFFWMNGCVRAALRHVPAVDSDCTWGNLWAVNQRINLWSKCGSPLSFLFF